MDEEERLGGIGFRKSRHPEAEECAVDARHYMRHPLIWFKMTPMLVMMQTSLLVAGRWQKQRHHLCILFTGSLDDENANVRQAAAAALGKRGAQPALN
jgi:HEAT repeat protein